MNSAIKYPGGKGQGKAEWLAGLAPTDATHYIEPFVGGGSVLFAMPRHDYEVVNDLDGAIINMFEVLRDSPDELQFMLALTPVGPTSWEQATTAEPTDDKVEWARRTVVRFRQSFSGNGTGAQALSRRIRRKMAENVSSWLSALDTIPEVAARLVGVQTTSQDFGELIGRFEQMEGAFFYCDPPYVLDSRSTKKLYDFEFTDADHRRMAEALHRVKGKVMVSAYPSPLYEELFADWTIAEMKTKKKAGGSTKAVAVEQAIMNYYPACIEEIQMSSGHAAPAAVL